VSSYFPLSAAGGLLQGLGGAEGHGPVQKFAGEQTDIRACFSTAAFVIISTAKVFA